MKITRNNSSSSSSSSGGGNQKTFRTASSSSSSSSSMLTRTATLIVVAAVAVFLAANVLLMLGLSDVDVGGGGADNGESTLTFFDATSGVAHRSVNSLRSDDKRTTSIENNDNDNDNDNHEHEHEHERGGFLFEDLEDEKGAVRHYDYRTHYVNPILKDKEGYDPDRPFAYDRDKWEASYRYDLPTGGDGDDNDNDNDNDNDENKNKTGSQRIVVLAGPHKAGSTALQAFFVKFAGMTVSLERNLTGDALREFNPHYSTNRSRFTHPTFSSHPAFENWIWPTGIKDEYDTGYVPVGQYPFADFKFYAPLISMIFDRALDVFFYRWRSFREDDVYGKLRYARSVMKYYRDVLNVPWSTGKNVVLGTEELDVFVRDLGTTPDPVASRFRPRWEKTHLVDRTASERIDDFLRVLPDHPTVPGSTDHVEIQINHRIPRMEHLVSVWKEIAQTQLNAGGGSGITLREFLSRFASELYTTNGLGLALQFAHRGIKTTLIVFDTSKAAPKDDIVTYDRNKLNKKESVFGGFYGLVGCEVLNLDGYHDKNRNVTNATTTTTTSPICDDRSRMHLDRFDGRLYMKSDLNKRDESVLDRDITPEEAERVERYLRDYDCSVWRYLRRYQSKGSLRVLNPPDDLFRDCPSEAEDVSYHSTLRAIDAYLGTERKKRLRAERAAEIRAAEAAAAAGR